MYSILHFSNVLHITIIFLLMAKGGLSTTFTFVNRCNYVVWPGILSNTGSSGFDTTGFELSPGSTRSLHSQPGWSGRFWGRTGCSFDSTGQGRCVTGDCGSNQIECNGGGAAPPATLAEFSIDPTTQDFYDVSLVDGYNLPMTVEPAAGSGSCETTGCITDLNRSCPSELRAVEGQACKSACEAFGNPEYCCSGEYGSPSTCRPSVYSEMFKSACPRAYSYAYDDSTSTFTCSGADYTITFCPSITSQKSSSSSTDTSLPDTAATTNGLPQPAATGEASDDDKGFLPAWLPSLANGGSSNFDDFRSTNHFIIYVATILLTFPLVRLL